MKKKTLYKTLLGIFISLIHFIPFYITITMAFKPLTDFSSRWLLPTELYLDNFVTAIRDAKILLAMQNSIIITVVSVTLIVLVGALAAYPLARFQTKFNRGVLNLVLGVMMVPPLSMLVPLYSNMAKWGGISTYWGIIVVITTFQLPMSIFLYTNFISTLPYSLDEAAAIDGCNKFQTFYRIILPLLKPVTATVVILTGVWVWNDYQFSLYFLQKQDMRTITLAIASFFSNNTSNLNAAAAASLIAILPIIVLYLAMQKYFVKGMVDGAVK
ncbi:carbohydrate ABC transporter permease [Acidaminobacter sp. JC074]|uniref:carbohydrate ABC transporter permease n=1 Tax=Acidaminobacter sp. JC074 TaxID=2530199 RepID=UPI001F0D54A4|nr:carbohydrate ABC transporter permease [Acidaminobacter sp. JC074]MCH4885951.1 carbohydrate ABC transporter permease [Acidaminobacter sp. JC074]